MSDISDGRQAQDDLLSWVQDWYVSQCDGDWEHQYGMRIDTLDNPGWHLSISLPETPVATRELQRVEIERNEDDWFQCWIGEGKFRERAFCAACGPRNLEEVLTIFRDWVEGASA